MENERDESVSVSALLKLLVHYYQIATLLHIEHVKQVDINSNKMDNVREIISNILSFRFVMYREICAIQDLNLPQREVIN